MKTAIVIVMTLALATFCGCLVPWGSGRGRGGPGPGGPGAGGPGPGGPGPGGKHGPGHHGQGQKGLSVEPTIVVVKASDSPDVQLQIAAAKDAALGEYPVVVKGTLETGEPTSWGFTVRVVAP